MQEEYDNYFSNLANTMQIARNAGFNGIIVVMGAIAFTPGKVVLPTNDDMTWAINHPELFTNYGSVIADFHSYYCFLHAWGDYPAEYNALKNLWLNTGRITEAQNMGIPVAHFEGGIRITDPNVAEQNAAYANALRLCNEQGISWLGWDYSSTDQFSMLSSLIPPMWNSSGQVLANAILEAPPTPPIDLPVIVAAGGLAAVDAILVAIYLAKISGYI
ncbi:hypothetical protein ES703_79401 [subsurface metagenome]